MKRFPSAGFSGTPAWGSGPGKAQSGKGVRVASGGNLNANAAATLQKKARRASRESFRPRPSLDLLEMKMGTGQGGKGVWAAGTPVREEEEDV